VPDKVPFWASDNPGGREPVIVQLYGGVPPEGANVVVYALPAVPTGSGDCVVMLSPGETVIVYPLLAVSAGELLSLTLAVKVYAPAAPAAMVPDKVPFWTRDNPGGREPVAVHLYGAVPPEAANVVVYALPAVPTGSGDCVVIAIDVFSMAITRPPSRMYSLELVWP
jgi:hypothetical protein